MYYLHTQFNGTKLCSSSVSFTRSLSLRHCNFNPADGGALISKYDNASRGTTRTQRSVKVV
jgi:hypothetical protein